MEVGETRDIGACHAVRRAVFIEEQGIDEDDDFDGLDEGALHVLATENSAPVGTARILVIEGAAKIGRVAVLKSHRGKGVGKQILRSALEISREAGLTRAKLEAQTTAIGFYEDLGFVAEGEEFLDVGIPHRLMTREL